MAGNAEPGPIPGDLRRVLLSLLVLAAVAFACLVLYRAAHPAGSELAAAGNPRSGYRLTAVTGFTREKAIESVRKNVSLGRILQEASMENRTVILTTLNEAWAVNGSIFDLFLESFRLGYHTRRLLDHLVVIAFDPKAYARCILVHAYCYALTTEGVDFSAEKYFLTPDYLKMMWRRIDFLRTVLEMGYNFVFTDADIMWFRDPFPQFYPGAEFQIACDQYFGDPLNINNHPNGGFNYVKSTNSTKEFYKFWYLSRETYPGYHDQDVLNKIKFGPEISEIGLKITYLDTTFFGGICEPSRDFRKVCTMHANCCCGLNDKIHDLRIMLEDWRRFMSLPVKLKKSSTSSWRVPQKCSISDCLSGD